MNKLAIAVFVLAACKGDDKKPAVQQAKPADDPWSTQKATAKDTKDPELARLIELAQTGPGKMQYPQADAIVAFERDDITYDADGSVVTKHHSIVKLIDPQRGKEKFADLHIPFDSKRETLTIDTARTVNDDGKANVASKDEIGDIVPARLADATIYSDVRERVISFPAVDAGSVLELKYTRTQKPSPDSPLGGIAMLGRWNPILERVVTITAPANVTPKFAVEGVTLKPAESRSGGNRVWTFRLKDLPDRQPEHGSLTDEAVLSASADA